MKTRYRGISERPGKGVSSWMGSGYIVVPDNCSGESRDQYVETCYRKERVGVLPERGGTPNWNCSITREALKNITFPKTSKNLGSAVIFFSDERGNVMVVGTVSKLDESLNETEFVKRVSSKYEDTELSVIMNPKDKTLFIEAKGGKSPVELSVNLSNLSENCELNIGVSGDISIDLSGDFKLEGSTISNKAGDIEINLDGSKVEVKNNIESLKTILDDIITAINSITVPTGVGPSGVPINAAQFISIQQRLDLLMK